MHRRVCTAAPRHGELYVGSKPNMRVRKAWADNDDEAAAEVYLARVPRIHGRVCDRYGIPMVELSPLMAKGDRDFVF